MVLPSILADHQQAIDFSFAWHILIGICGRFEGGSMDQMRNCANQAIGDFVKNEVGSPPYPNWTGCVPGDSSNGGWTDKAAVWRRQAGQIIAAFEQCSGLSIDVKTWEKDAAFTHTLADFSDFLVEKAGLASAKHALRAARAHLAALKAAAKVFRRP